MQEKLEKNLAWSIVINVDSITISALSWLKRRRQKHFIVEKGNHLIEKYHKENVRKAVLLQKGRKITANIS